MKKFNFYSFEKELNQKTDDYRAVEKKELSSGQIVVILLGILLWILFLIGVFMPVEDF